jgi:thioredoxin
MSATSTASSSQIVVCPNCGAKNRIDRSRDAQPVCGRCKTPLPALDASASSSDHPLELTDATFDSALQSAGDRPVLVDCWATWCPPCRAIAPTIEQLAAESRGRWVIAKLDVDQNQQTAARFRIEGIPALLIFKNGRQVDLLVGLQPKAAIVAKLEAHA